MEISILNFVSILATDNSLILVPVTPPTASKYCPKFLEAKSIKFKKSKIEKILLSTGLTDAIEEESSSNSWAAVDAVDVVVVDAGGGAAPRDSSFAARAWACAWFLMVVEASYSLILLLVDGNVVSLYKAITFAYEIKENVDWVKVEVLAFGTMQR